jgi:hypothetical protein
MGLGLGVWVAVVAVGVAWGTWWIDRNGVALRAAPVMGHWDPHVRLASVPAVALGGAVVRWGSGLAARAPWRAVPLVTGLVASAWTVALAASDGWSRLTEPLTTRHEYEPLAARVDGLLPFLDGYVDRLGEYPIHVQGHPPGPVVVAWALDRVGLGGAGWLALVAIAAWGVAVAAALVAARAVAGERSARRAAPALAVLPAAVWAGTSLDPLFAAVAATGIALLAQAGRQGGSSGGRRGAWAAAGGATLGAALLCSYGAVPLLLVAAAGVVVTAGGAAPLWRTAAVAAIAGGAVLGAAAAAGFWWPDGLAATQDAYWEGIGADRPGLYLTLVGNPAALALAVGPATAAGLVAVLRRAVRRTPFWAQQMAAEQPVVVPRIDRDWVLPLVALAAVAAANLSQMSRGEVERIWLPFVPWLALAAPGDRRWWLAAQVGLGLALQSVLVSPW